MREIQLTPKELIYVASILGAKEFFGIPDPFFGMERGEIATCVNAIQSDLNQKGILEMDFSGSVRVCEPVANVVNKCAFCDAYALGVFQVEGGIESMVVYFKNQEMISLTSQDSSLYIHSADIKEIRSKFSSILEEKKCGSNVTSSKARSCFTYQTIEKLRKLAIAGDDTAAQREINAAGIDEAIGKVFLGCFHSEAKLYTLVVTNFAVDQVELLLCIFYHGSLVCVRQERNSNSGEWIAEEVSGKEFTQYIEELLERTRLTQ